MKKLLKDILVAVSVLAVVCLVFWQLGWITAWQDAVLLYFLLALAIGMSIVKNAVMNKAKKCQCGDEKRL